MTFEALGIECPIIEPGQGADTVEKICKLVEPVHLQGPTAALVDVKARLPYEAKVGPVDSQWIVSKQIPGVRVCETPVRMAFPSASPEDEISDGKVLIHVDPGVSISLTPDDPPFDISPPDAQALKMTRVSREQG